MKNPFFFLFQMLFFVVLFLSIFFLDFYFYLFLCFFFLLAASLWGPYKDIWQTVMNAIWKRQPEAIHRLDQVLKKHRSDFISLFRNPVLD